MKAIKWMLFGIALILFGVCCLFAGYVDGKVGIAWLGMLCPMFGLIICILAVSMKN